MVMYDDEFDTKETKVLTKDKTEPQHIHRTKVRLHVDIKVDIISDFLA